MKTYPLTFLEIGILTGTRALAAAGLALAISTRVPREKRGPIGWSLFGAGAGVYLCLLADVLLRNRAEPPSGAAGD